MLYIVNQSYLSLAQLIRRAQTPCPLPTFSLNAPRFLSYPFPRNPEMQGL